MKRITYLLTLILLFGINSAQAQHGFGTNSPDAQAVIDASATNKGILIPRVALTAANNISPFTATPTKSMLVYNTATSGTSPNNVTQGYYYWNGSSWERITNGSDTGATLSQGQGITAFSYDGSANATVAIADGSVTTTMIANATILPEDMEISNSGLTWNFTGTLQQGGNDVMTDELTEGAIWYGNASDVATELARGTNGQVLSLSSGLPTWVDPSAASEVDGVIGNEVLNATDTTLHRSGTGTNGDPYTLAVNQDFPFTFTNTITFTDTVFINATGNHGIIIQNGGFAMSTDSIGPTSCGVSCEKWVFDGYDSTTIFKVVPSSGGNHYIYEADMPDDVAEGSIMYVLNASESNVAIATEDFPRDDSIRQGRIGVFIFVRGQWYFNK